MMEVKNEQNESNQDDSASQQNPSTSAGMNQKKGNFQPRGGGSGDRGRPGGKNFVSRGGRLGGGGMNNSNRGLKSEVSEIVIKFHI